MTNTHNEPVLPNSPLWLHKALAVYQGQYPKARSQWEGKTGLGASPPKVDSFPESPSWGPGSHQLPP